MCMALVQYFVIILSFNTEEFQTQNLMLVVNHKRQYTQKCMHIFTLCGFVFACDTCRCAISLRFIFRIIVSWNKKKNLALLDLTSKETSDTEWLCITCVTSTGFSIEVRTDDYLRQHDAHKTSLSCKIYMTFQHKYPWSTDMENLTHWGRDKMAAIFQTTFSNGFSLMKMYEFRLTFHWSLFLGVQLTIFQHWFR